MTDSWKHKHIDDWTSKELQNWIVSIKLGSKNQKKVTATIIEQEICGEDFNTMQTKPEIMESFPDINAMSGNKIFAALKRVRNSKNKKQPKNKKPSPPKNEKPYGNAKNYPPEKKKPQTWKAKHIDSWSCQELQDWLGTIGLNAKDERRLQEAIDIQGIEGEDFNSMETSSDICESFDGINKNIGNKIYAELNKVRRMRRSNSNEKQYNKYKPKPQSHSQYSDDPYQNNSFQNDSGQYADTPYDYEAEKRRNAKLASQYSDSPYQPPPPKYNNNNNNNTSSTYKRPAYVNPNSLQGKVNKIRQQYPELDDDTIKEVLARHNNNLNQTLRFIGMKKKQMEEEQKKKEVEEIAHMFGSLVSLAVVEEAGFVLAKPENRAEIVRRLTRVEPSGQTALRDAVVIGIAHMLKVKIALARIGALKHKFVHVVLTDGYDTASDSSFSELQEFFYKLGKELGDMCTTYFVGVGLDEEEKEELESITQIGGDSCELFNCDDVRIGDVFKRIAVSLGIRQEIVAVQHQGMIVAAANEKLMVRVEEQQFLVLFTLDISASMLDGRWDKVVAAVAGFMTGLKPTDIIGAIIFNEKCVIITDQ